MRVKISAIKNKVSFFKVTPFKSIDTDTHEDFREQIKPLLVPSPRGILLDLEKIDYISSAGLGVIFLIKKTLTANGGQLVIYHPKPHIQKLLKLVRGVLKESLFASLEEADAFIQSIAPAPPAKKKKNK